MARRKKLENMSYAELAAMQARIEKAKAVRQHSDRAALRQKINAMAKEHGFDLHDLFGARRRGKGSVAIKYRDPHNPTNTWTGRGRTPRWMTAAMRGGKAKKEDFLVR